MFNITRFDCTFVSSFHMQIDDHISCITVIHYNYFYCKERSYFQLRQIASVNKSKYNKSVNLTLLVKVVRSVYSRQLKYLPNSKSKCHPLQP